MTRTSPSRHAAAAVLALALVAAGCGTRLDDDEFAARQEVATGAGGTGGAAAGAGGTATGPRAGGAGPAATVPGGAPAPGATPDGAPAPGAPPDGAPAAEGGGAPAGPNQASDVGITETTVKIGTIVAENGVLGDTFQPAVTGLRAWVEQVNAQGGIGGRTLELATCDDREDRARTLECARRLVEQDQVFALIATNTRAMGGAAEYLNEQAIPVLGNPINNAFYRYPHFFSVYGAPYARDGSAVGQGGRIASYSTPYRWLKTELGASKAAVFSYDIAESAQAGDFFEAGLRAEGFEVTRHVVSFAAPSFDAAVADMQRQGVEVIVDSMDPGANVRLCDAMARRGFTVRAKVSTIPTMSATFGERFNDACRPVTYVVGDSVPFTDTSNPLVAAYQDAMGRYQRRRVLHQWGLESWAMGSLLQEALVAMGPAPTRAGFEQYLLGLRAASPGGVMTPTIQWVPNDPDLGAGTVRDCIGVSRWDDGAGGWVAATPFPYCVDDAVQYFTDAAEQGN